MRKLLTIAIVSVGLAMASATTAEAHGPRFFIGVGVPGFYGGYGGYGYGYPYGYGYRGYYGYPGYYPPPYPGYGYYPPPPPPVVIQSPPVVVQAPPVAVQAPQAPAVSSARAAGFAPPPPAPAPSNAAPVGAPQQYYYNAPSTGYYYPY